MENRSGLIVDARLTLVSGRAERLAALEMIEPFADRPRAITLGADKGYDTADFVEELRTIVNQHRNGTPLRGPQSFDISEGMSCRVGSRSAPIGTPDVLIPQTHSKSWPLFGRGPASVPIYTRHHLPDEPVGCAPRSAAFPLFPKPETFRPERWGDRQHPRFAYFPFGGGPRICIGQPLAMMEEKLVLAMVCQRFRLAAGVGAPVRPYPSVTLRPDGPVRLVVTRRVPE